MSCLLPLSSVCAYLILIIPDSSLPKMEVQEEKDSSGEKSVSSEEAGSAPSAAQRARAERNLQRARALRSARARARAAPADTGGGFLAETACEAPRAAPPPAPIPDPAERPDCLECGCRFAHSHLFDTFEFPVCDACRDDEGAHELLTRTEAKAEFLLRDADLDSRGPPLRCIVRRNPHAPRGDMRLYVRAAVLQRALLVWGSQEALEAEHEARAARRVESKARRGARALRALRMSVRSSLFAGARAPHEHAWGEERYDAASDTYERACACGHVQRYEKM